MTDFFKKRQFISAHLGNPIMMIRYIEYFSWVNKWNSERRKMDTERSISIQKQNHKVTVYGKAGSQEARAKIHCRSMLTSIGATSRTAVPGATLRHVWTSYCGSCIKVHREDWGRGTKKVKLFAHTRVRNWSINFGLIHLWAGYSLAENTSPPNTQCQVWAGALSQEEDWTTSTIYHHHPLTGWGVSTENVKASDTCHQHPLERRYFPWGKCSHWHVIGEFLVMFIL